MVAGRAREEVGDAEEQAHAQQDGQREVLTARHGWNVGMSLVLLDTLSLHIQEKKKKGEKKPRFIRGFVASWVMGSSHSRAAQRHQAR